MSDDDVVSLAARRADKANDCTLWTPIDALNHAKKEIKEARNVQEIMIHWFETNEDGSSTLRFAVAGLSREGLIAKLAFIQHRAIEDWRGS